MKFTLQTGVDNAILRKISDPVKKTDISRVSSLAREMVRYVKDPKNGCIGLAAPQVGHNIRIIAVGLPVTREQIEEDVPFPYVAMINPEIISHSSDTCDGEEGCLSLPQERYQVARWMNILVEYLDDRGLSRKLQLSGFAARVVQHEIDHLNGVLMSDRVIDDMEHNRSILSS